MHVTSMINYTSQLKLCKNLIGVNKRRHVEYGLKVNRLIIFGSIRKIAITTKALQRDEQNVRKRI